MTRERYKELMENQDLKLTEEEIKSGWHFCPEMDSLLADSTDPNGDCFCELRSSRNEEAKQRLIQISDQRKEFVQDVDGFIYWWPDGSPNGHFSSHHLRWLADELDKRNKPWNEQIAKDLSL